MTEPMTQPQVETSVLPNGFGAAAVLAAATGAFALGVCTLIAELSPKAKAWLGFSHGAGQLSGETTLAIAVWLVCWLLHGWRWNAKNVAMKPVLIASCVLVVLALLLTFPPLLDLL